MGIGHDIVSFLILNWKQFNLNRSKEGEEETVSNTKVFFYNLNSVDS